MYSREEAISGIACMIPENLQVCLGQPMMLLRTNGKVTSRCLMYFLNSPTVISFVASITGGSASPHKNEGDIKMFRIPVPSVAFQMDIVNQIESRLSVCDSIEQTVDTALSQADALRQSILKEAFEGRLA